MKRQQGMMIWTVLATALLVVGCQREEASLQSQPAVRAVAQAAHVARGRLRFVESYETGYEQAAREGKPMLVFFTATWCNFCHQMAEEAFTNDQVVSLSERFVCILVDADKQPELCREFEVRGYPTIQFLSPRGTPLNRITGKRPGQQVVMEMQSALQDVARHVPMAGGSRRG